ncbi:hypothetical protein CGLO_16410 [Colletotrichum gloeosporioides Cg-14]|uniref:Uncharacterized protein n=1 Tax=Colletotrichum gloeosporioides (strain Cg-14) TaxID=1237896 RepID=T0KZQ4_COLGC|nr:hypothetical protein CGLO_16410 [Colletotrichum gloeosporioides Cg-14]
MDALQRALDDGNRSRLGPYNRMGETPLHLAAKLGRLSCAKRLLAMEIDSHVRDVDGNTALMMAVEYEHLGMVIALWGEIADINESDDHLDALRNAVDYQLFDIVKFMLEHDGKAEGYIFSQLLYRAAKVGNDKIVALLLRKQGVEVDATDEESEDAPLHIASIEGHEKVVQMLLAAGADVHCESSPNTTPLHLAAKAGKVEVCRILIKSGARLDEWNVHGDTPLILALDDGHGAVVKFLLEAGANCNLESSSGLTALHVAASRGLVEVCGNLIKYGASLDARNALGDTPLILAVDQGHSTVVQCLLDAGANCGLASPNGDTALHAAAAEGLVDICRILIGHNGGLVLALLDGVTPLQTAVKKNHLGIANLFLDNSSTEAAKLGYVDICTTLLNHNASTCIRTKKEHSRRTPLLEAIVDDKPGIVRLLLERGACGADQNDDTADDWEDYPLFLAASLDRVSCLEHLVKYGSINFEFIGLNAIAHAVRHGRVAAVKLLLEKGATGVPPTGLKGKWKNLKITPEGEAKAEEALKILRELSNTRANGFPAMGLKDKWKNLKATPAGEADANEKEMTANDREANAHENEVKAFENELKNGMEAFKNELNAYDSEVLETPRDRLNTLATEPPATGLKSKWKNLKANPEGEAKGEANEVLGTLKELSNATQKLRVKGKAFVGLVQTLKRR